MDRVKLCHRTHQTGRVLKKNLRNMPAVLSKLITLALFSPDEA